MEKGALSTLTSLVMHLAFTELASHIVVRRQQICLKGS